MANVIFKLRTLKSTNAQIIYLVYRFGRNDKLVYSTGLKIEPKYWNEKKMRVRDMIEALEKDIINNRLNELQTLSDAFITKETAQAKEITKDTLRSFLDSVINPPKNDTDTLHGFMIDFIEQSSKRVWGRTGKIVGSKTQLSYKRTLKYLEKYEQKTKQTLDFKDLGLDFYNKYTTFLQTFGLSVNTIGREIKTLRTILNEAKMRGKELNRDFLNGCFIVTKEESESVYLNESELSLLYEYDFNNNKKLDRVRDLFLVGAWTGLRFSDFIRITKDNISNGVIHIEQQKTNKSVSIPLHPIVLEIWNKYGQSIPKTISNQKFNDYIKEVCKLAGIKEHEHKAITKGGVRQSKRFEKWELVSSHTARRSFATNLFLSGFPALSIMQITGHKTEAAFMKYIKVTPEQHAKLLQAHWIKNNQYMKIAK